MATQELKINITIAPWFRYVYMPMVGLLCNLTGHKPDMDKFCYWLEKAIKVKLA